mgnify:CR=1 FL=1
MAVGNLMQLLVVMKGLPLSYNRDMQEDKASAMSSYQTMISCLHMVGPMYASLAFDRERMAAACADGFLNATDLADHLVQRGMPFRQAHEVVGAVVRHAIERKGRLEDLSLKELKGFCDLIEEDVFELLPIERCVARRTSLGGTSPLVFAPQVERARSEIKAQASYVERERKRIAGAFSALLE